MWPAVMCQSSHGEVGMRLPDMNDLPECEVGYVGARHDAGARLLGEISSTLRFLSRQLHVATDHRDL